MTIRDNDDTGYDSDSARERDVQQQREQERIARDNPELVAEAEPLRDTTEYDFDVFDALNDGETPVGVQEIAWDLVLKRLGHMQSQETNHLMKAKTVEELWELFSATT